MWNRGLISVKNSDGSVKNVLYEAKVYDEGSEYGINGGRISKLWLGIAGQKVASYDRGWDIEPTCEEANTALCVLLNEYN